MTDRPDDAAPDWPTVAADVHRLLEGLMMLQTSWAGEHRPTDAQESQEYLLDVLEVVRDNLRGFQNILTLLESILGRNDA